MFEVSESLALIHLFLRDMSLRYFVIISKKILTSEIHQFQKVERIHIVEPFL